jgi:hypothetical protein
VLKFTSDGVNHLPLLVSTVLGGALYDDKKQTMIYAFLIALDAA